MLEQILQDSIQKLKDALAQTQSQQAQLNSAIAEYNTKKSELDAQTAEAKALIKELKGKKAVVTAAEELATREANLNAYQKNLTLEKQQRDQAYAQAISEIEDRKGLLDIRERAILRRENDMEVREQTYKSAIEKEVLGSAIEKIKNL